VGHRQDVQQLPRVVVEGHRSADSAMVADAAQAQ